MVPMITFCSPNAAGNRSREQESAITRAEVMNITPLKKHAIQFSTNRVVYCLKKIKPAKCNS